MLSRQRDWLAISAEHSAAVTDIGNHEAVSPGQQHGGCAAGLALLLVWVLCVQRWTQ